MAEEWPFTFDRLARVLLAGLGVRATTARVRVDASMFRVDFGPWRLRTPLTNIADVAVTGPYRWLKAIGPRVSLADRGVTFGTNARCGVCVRFVEPVPALFPGGRLRHPGATVTVAHPEAFAAHLRRLSR
jgi:hypothetical protein